LFFDKVFVIIFFKSESCFFSAKMTSGIPFLFFLPVSICAMFSIFSIEYNDYYLLALDGEIFPICNDWKICSTFNYIH